MKRICIGVAMFPLVALAIAGGFSLYLAWAIPDPDFNLDWEFDPGVNADGSNLRIMQGRPDALASWSPDESQIAVYLPAATFGSLRWTPTGRISNPSLGGTASLGNWSLSVGLWI